MRRFNAILILIIIFFISVILRLFWWQIVQADVLKARAESQHFFTFEIAPSRGLIKSADGFELVRNTSSFLLFADSAQIKQTPFEIASRIAPVLWDESSKSAILSDFQKNLLNQLEEPLNDKNKRWIPIKKDLSREIKEKIEGLKISGLGFDKSEKRFYPESSMSAHLLGFVGSDSLGRSQGYFGLEGFYDNELKGRGGSVRQEKDALGRPILVGGYNLSSSQDGRNLILNLDRAIQFMVEKKLEEGIQKYGAKSGLVIVAEPKTGKVLALAVLPKYNPSSFDQFSSDLYRNPAIADTYEPGSTFKVIVMAAALNEHLVKPDTVCDRCSGPVQIGGFIIRTWNNKYYPNSTLKEILQHSDNIGMTFVGDKLGLDKFYKYLVNFGFGQSSGIDLQEDAAAELRPQKDWKVIDLATASFGQGIAVTPIQMIKAVGALANGGKLMTPQIVNKIEGTDKTIEIKPKIEKQVINPETAKIITEMMVFAVDNGEAKWAKPAGFRIAGKTGTAQIPISGYYDEKKTIASFIGFAPADDPRFVMLVRLQEPSSSPWGSETAAPLFFNISRELFTYWGIPPQ